MLISTFQDPVIFAAEPVRHPAADPHLAWGPFHPEGPWSPRSRSVPESALKGSPPNATARMHAVTIRVQVRDLRIAMA